MIHPLNTLKNVILHVNFVHKLQLTKILITVNHVSYSKPGNCYINILDIQAEKIVDNVNEIFISNSCSTKKIDSTGECIDQCPDSSPFYSIEYDENEKKYTNKINLNPPKYLFNKKCLEECPSKTNPDTNNICKCQYAFHIENGKTICYDNLDCNINYPYQNKDTNECYSSLSKCNFFFNKNCYENSCPTGKISLSSLSDTIKNYYKNNLLLDDSLANKICICDINQGVWSNITSSSGEQYFQECLISCPQDYEPESLTRQCIEKKEIPTTIIENPTTIIENPTTIIENPTTVIENPTNIDNCAPSYSEENNNNYLNCLNENCSFYHYYDDNNKYYCTDNYFCPKEFGKLIEDKKECIKTCILSENNLYKYEYKNKCYKKIHMKQKSHKKKSIFVSQYVMKKILF